MSILSGHFSGIDECDKIKTNSYDGMFTNHFLDQDSDYEKLNENIYIKKLKGKNDNKYNK